MVEIKVKANGKYPTWAVRDQRHPVERDYIPEKQVDVPLGGIDGNQCQGALAGSFFQGTAPPAVPRVVFISRNAIATRETL